MSLEATSTPDLRCPSPPAGSVGLLLVLMLAAGSIVALVHWPVLSCRAISMNDGRYVTMNPLVLNPSLASAGRFLREVRQPSTVKGYYQPLAMISLMLDAAAGGSADNARPFHRTSLALHVANTVLLTTLLYLLFHRPWVAAGIGLLFGAHPMTVEAIAWLGERKTPLATCFALTSLILYVAYARRRKRWPYAVSLLAFILALMSKPTVTPLPVMLLLLDYWPLRRLGRRAVIEKLPFLAVAAVFAIITVISQHHIEASVQRELSAFQLWLVVCHNVIFYPLKMLRPVHLSSVYAFPDPLALSHPMVFTGLVATGLLAVASLVCLRWTRALLAAVAMFLIMLGPTFLNVEYSMGVAADKYAYLPAVGLLIGLAWLLCYLWHRSGNDTGGVLARRVVIVCAVAMLALAEARATRRYLTVWRDTESLCRHILDRVPDTAWAHDLLGLELLAQGDDRRYEAISHFQKAIRLKPDAYRTHVNLAQALVQTGQPELAIAHLQQAVSIKPNSPEAHYHLAIRLAARDQIDQAIAELNEALTYRPDFPEAHHGLGLLLAAKGQIDQAIDHHQQAIRIRPDYAETHFRLALLFARQHRSAEAITHYRKALESEPDVAVIHLNLGIELVRQSDLPQATLHFERARQLDPRNADTLCLLGDLYERAGRIGEAIEAYQQALAVKPDHQLARQGLDQARQRAASQPATRPDERPRPRPTTADETRNPS